MNELFVITVSIGLINITSQFVFKKKICIPAMKDLWMIFMFFKMNLNKLTTIFSNVIYLISTFN